MGKTLLRSVSENAAIWQDEHPALAALTPAAGPRQHEFRSSLQKRCANQVNHDIDAGDTARTSRTKQLHWLGALGCPRGAFQRKQLCEKFNDQRSCSDRNCREHHRCEAVLTSNKVCGGEQPRVRRSVHRDCEVKYN